MVCVVAAKRDEGGDIGADDDGDDDDDIENESLGMTTRTSFFDPYAVYPQWCRSL